jgi:glycosyltransferase involved in cell wall biosynthesis
LRLFHLLRSLVSTYEVDFCAYGAAGQRQRLGTQTFQSYLMALEDEGIRVFADDPVAVVQRKSYGLTLFEFHFAAARYMSEFRRRRPGLRLVIDTVDVHFNRLESQARVTGEVLVSNQARAERSAELGVYRAADALIVVSKSESELLRAHGITTPQYVIPNFHELPHFDLARQMHPDLRLLFVGGFAHVPNVDAINFFCADVWPLVRRQLPTATLAVVGSHPPPAVQKWAGSGIEILGYVPDLDSIFASSDVSIAPLRFGGGVKGKVGEAMAVGLPVVSTAVGVEGMGIVDGVHALIADSPETFAAKIVGLAANPILYSSLRSAAREHIARTMSIETAGGQARMAVAQISNLVPKRLSLGKRLANALRSLFQQHVAWRWR